MKFRLPKFRSFASTEASTASREREGGSCARGDELYKNYDRGNLPTTLNLDILSKENKLSKNVLWTGEGLQLSLINIPKGAEAQLKRQDDADLIIKLSSGTARISMGENEENLYFKETVGEGGAIIVPRGTFYRLDNVGSAPLRLTLISSSRLFPYGTVEQ